MMELPVRHYRVTIEYGGDSNGLDKPIYNATVYSHISPDLVECFSACLESGSRVRRLVRLARVVEHFLEGTQGIEEMPWEGGDEARNNLMIAAQTIRRGWAKWDHEMGNIEGE